MEYLSNSDLLNPSWDSFGGGRGFPNRDQGSHILRQDEMAFEVAVRGLLFSLPHPVKRKGASNGKTGDAFKMFYPASIKLWKTREELGGLVDWWASRILKQESTATDPSLRQHSASTNGASLFRKSKPDVTKRAGNQDGQDDAIQGDSKSIANHVSGEALPLLSLGSSARHEMVLERLPYMAHLARQGLVSLMPLDLHDLEKVVSFRGLGTPANQESDEEVEGAPGPVGEGWATDRPSEDRTPRKKRTNVIKSQSGQSEGSMFSNLQVQKLVLSDDDIEDDE
jgi:cell cycle checkpoint protein